MDEMTALRRLRAEITRPGPDRLTPGRQRLQAAVEEETQALLPASGEPEAGGDVDGIRITKALGRDRLGRFRRRPFLGAVVATATAVAVTATVVVADGMTDRQASAPYVTDAAVHPVSAKKVLRAAADRVREEEKGARPEAPRDDQFIYTRDIVKETDRKTGETDVRTAENWRSSDGSKRGWVDEIGGTGTWVEPLGKNESTFPPSDWESQKKIPKDPAGLIRYLARNQAGTDPDAESLKKIKKREWYVIQFSLRGLATQPVSPKGLRPAALDALALVPGMRASTGVEDGDGRPALGVFYDHKFTRDQKLVFDENSHAYLGERGVRTTLKSKRSYDQFIRTAEHAVVDKVKQRP